MQCYAVTTIPFLCVCAPLLKLKRYSQSDERFCIHDFFFFFSFLIMQEAYLIMYTVNNDTCRHVILQVGCSLPLEWSPWTHLHMVGMLLLLF